MKYLEVNFLINAPKVLMQDARDVLSALTGEAGFETFEETDNGLKGYVQQALFNQTMLDELLTNFLFEGVTVDYTVTEAEDRDWNEQWELEGFEPIVIDRRCVIHDGRHFNTLEQGKDSLGAFDMSIEIDTHMAFGTGTHETTRMMLSSLLDLPLTGKRVLDCGCGTGILGIAALKAGAAECIGYDIDQWSVDNALHNTVINRVDERFEAMLGDATVLDNMKGGFDVVMANINRNILLADMPSFCMVMKPEATLLLSGFYQEDTELLKAKAENLGLRLQNQRSDGEWCCMEFRRR